MTREMPSSSPTGIFEEANLDEPRSGTFLIGTCQEVEAGFPYRENLGMRRPGPCVYARMLPSLVIAKVHAPDLMESSSTTERPFMTDVI
jgi:hypothetical protein